MRGPRQYSCDRNRVILERDYGWEYNQIVVEYSCDHLGTITFVIDIQSNCNRLNKLISITIMRNQMIVDRIFNDWSYDHSCYPMTNRLCLLYVIYLYTYT